MAPKCYLLFSKIAVTDALLRRRAMYSVIIIDANRLISLLFFRDETMADKFMHIPMKRIDTRLRKPTNQKFNKSPKVVKPTRMLFIMVCYIFQCVICSAILDKLLFLWIFAQTFVDKEFSFLNYCGLKILHARENINSYTQMIV